MYYKIYTRTENNYSDTAGFRNYSVNIRKYTAFSNQGYGTGAADQKVLEFRVGLLDAQRRGLL